MQNVKRCKAYFLQEGAPLGVEMELNYWQHAYQLYQKWLIPSSKTRIPRFVKWRSWNLKNSGPIGPGPGEGGTGRPGPDPVRGSSGQL